MARHHHAKHHHLKKRFYFITATVSVLIIAVCVGLIFHLQNKPADRSAGKTPSKTSVAAAPDSFEDLPENYYTSADRQGKLERVTYKTKLTDGSGRSAEKHAMVYIPYGYDKNDKKQKCNTFYLMHGYGGDYHTYLGRALLPRTFKHILDHMIEDEKMPPTIVVTPNITEEYADYYTSLDALGAEITGELIPLIESKYNVYTSREHRAVGGFSMGGCATWRALKNHSQHFKYYLPMSMPMYYDESGYIKEQSLQYAAEIQSGASASGYSSRQLFVFAASGLEDFMCDATKHQAYDLCAYKQFKRAGKSFENGNVIFHAWKGHHHSFKESYPYLYNGLMRFYRDYK